MPSNRVTVIKVGGSLLDWPGLPERFMQFFQRRRAEDPTFRPAVFCGGGPFADVIRRLDQIHHLGEFASHRMAIQAMDYSTAILFCLLRDAVPIDSEESLGAEMEPGDIPLLTPSLFFDDLETKQPSPLPASWDVTSDTFAAWIAGRLKARSLILLKSAPLPPHATRETAARLKLVDPFFPLISTGVARVEYLNLRDAAATAEILP
jgi:aspartokinase-like uncharacterized kinase